MAAEEEGQRLKEPLASMASDDESRGGEASASRLLPSRHRPLLPKPRVWHKWKLLDLSVVKRQTQSHCPVPECRIQHCKLRSHRNYNSWRQYKYATTAASDVDACLSTSSSENLLLDSDELLDFSIVHGGVDGMPMLPIDSLQTPILRELLNLFFTREWDRIAIVVSPPPISDAQRRMAEETKQEKLALAFSEPIFCLNYIAAAHFPISFRTSYKQQDRTTTILQVQIMSLLRKRMNEKQELHAHDVVVILAIVMIEIATGHTESLLVHRKAMKHLVAKLGGLHYMGHCIPFIQNLDRIFCIFTNAPLCFPPLLHKPVRRPYPHAHIYGSFFERSTSKNFNKLIMEYCFDSCRIIELIEIKGWNFTPADNLEGIIPDLHYIYYLRECLVNDFAQLNAQTYANGNEIDRCILLTAKIVDYVVTQDNYIIAIPFHFAESVRDILIKQIVDLSSSSLKRDILRWILFVLCSMPIAWDGREWSINLLKRQLQIEYTGTNADTLWPSDWRDIEFKNVQKFVWSNTRLHSSWEQACDDLEGNKITELEF